MTFDEWYKDTRFSYLHPDEYFELLIAEGFFKHPVEMKAYMRIAFDAALKINTQNQ